MIKQSWASFFGGAFISMQAPFWSVVYTGGGHVDFTPAGIILKPAGAIKLEQTHSALVLSKDINAKYFDVEIVYQNIQTLRVGISQPWEVFWLFFNYQTEASGHKKTNYLIVKPNGLEVGTATAEVQQTILRTWDNPTSNFKVDHRLRIQRMSTKIIITFDQQPSVVYEFIKDKDKFFDQKGSIGLYTEDAEVLIKSFKFKKL